MDFDNFQNNPRIIECGGDQVPEPFNHTEADSQTSLEHELVYLSATGKVTVCATGATAILGQQLQDGGNVTSGHPTVHGHVIKPGYKVKMRITNNGTDTLNSSAVVGVSYGHYVASNVHYADLNVVTAAAGCWTYLEPVLDTEGNATYWGIFTLRDAQSQWAHGTTTG